MREEENRKVKYKKRLKEKRGEKKREKQEEKRQKEKRGEDQDFLYTPGLYYLPITQSCAPPYGAAWEPTSVLSSSHH